MEEEEFEFLNNERVSPADFEFIQPESIRNLDEHDDFVVHENYFNDNKRSSDESSSASDHIPIVKRPKRKKKSKVKELSTLTDLKGKIPQKKTKKTPPVIKDDPVPKPSYSQVLQGVAENKSNDEIPVSVQIAESVENEASIDPFIETVLQLSVDKIDPLIERVLELSEEDKSEISIIAESTVAPAIADVISPDSDYALPDVVTLDEFMIMNDTKLIDDVTSTVDVTPMNDVPLLNDVIDDVTSTDDADVVTTLEGLVNDVTEANDVIPVDDVTEEVVSIDDITEEVVSIDDITEEVVSMDDTSEEVVSDDDVTEELFCDDDVTEEEIVFEDDVTEEVVCDDVTSKDDEDSESDDDAEESDDEDDDESCDETHDNDVTDEPLDEFPLNTFDSTYFTRSLDSYGLKELFDDRLVSREIHNRLIALKTSTLMMAVTASILIGVLFGNCFASFFVDVTPTIEMNPPTTPINIFKRRQEKYTLKVNPAPANFNYSSIWFGESNEENLMVVLKAYRRLQRDNTRLHYVINELRENVHIEKQMKWYWRRQARQDSPPPVRFVLHDGLMKVPEPTPPVQPPKCKEEVYNVTIVAKDTPYVDVIGNLTKSLENERLASKYWRNRFKDLSAHASKRQAGGEQGGGAGGHPQLFVTSKFNMFSKAFRRFNISSNLCRKFRNLSKPGENMIDHVRSAWYRLKSQWKLKKGKDSSTRMNKLSKLFQMSNVVNSFNLSRSKDRYEPTNFECHPVNSTNDPTLMGLSCYSIPKPKAMMKREVRKQNKDVVAYDNATQTPQCQEKKKPCNCHAYAAYYNVLQHNALKWFKARYEREIFLLKVSNWRSNYRNKKAVQNGRLEASKMKTEKDKEIEELERKVLMLRLKLGSYKRKMLTEKKEYNEQRTKYDEMIVRLDSLLRTNEQVMSAWKESKQRNHERTEELVKKIKQRERSRSKRKLDETKTMLKSYIENELKRIEERNRVENRNKLQKEKLKKKVNQYKSLYELSVEERSKLRLTNSELRTDRGIHKSIITNLLGKIKALRIQVRHYENEKKEMSAKMAAYINIITTSHITGNRNADVSEMTPHNDDERDLSVRYPEDEEIYTPPDCREPETTPRDTLDDAVTKEFKTEGYDLGGNVTIPFSFGGTGNATPCSGPLCFYTPYVAQRRRTSMRLRSTAVGHLPIFYMSNPTSPDSNEPDTETPRNAIPTPPRSIHIDSFFDSHEKYDNIDISVSEDEKTSDSVADKINDDDVDADDEVPPHIDYPIMAQSTQGKEIAITFLQPPFDLTPRRPRPRGIRVTKPWNKIPVPVANSNGEVVKEEEDEKVKVESGPVRKPNPPPQSMKYPFRSFIRPPPFLMSDSNLTVEEEFDSNHYDGESTQSHSLNDDEEEDNSNEYPGPSPPRENMEKKVHRFVGPWSMEHGANADYMREIEEYEITMIPTEGKDGKKQTGYIIRGKLKDRNMKKKNKE